MPDEHKEPKTRIRKFPIRQFSKLLDEFLLSVDRGLEEASVNDLRNAVDQALLKAYKS